MDKRLNKIIGSAHTVVDLGCGSGELLNSIKDKFDLCIGLDVSTRRLEEFAGGNIMGWQFYKVDLNKHFPLKDNTVNVIIANQVIEHIICPESFVREIHRVLKPNGRFIVTTPNIRYLKNLLNILFSGYGPRTSGGNLLDGSWDDGHLHYFTHGDLRGLFSSVGFQEVNSRALINQPESNWLKRMMDYNSTKLVIREYLSGNILLWGSK